MLASIVFSVLLHVSGQMEPVDPHLIPGQISISYREYVTPDQRKAFEQSVGLPEPISESRCVVCTYKVPEGHEQFWETVVKAIGGIRILWRVEQPRRRIRSDDAAGPHGEVTWRMRKPFKGFSASFAEMLDAKINQYFSEKYANIATVNVVKRGDHFVELSIDKMKGQVIAERGFWERLDIYVVFFHTQKEARLYVDFDGSFATGIGSRPPPDESYSNMGRSYDWELRRYADMTTTALKSYLEKNQ